MSLDEIRKRLPHGKKVKANKGYGFAQSHQRMVVEQSDLKTHVKCKAFIMSNQAYLTSP